MKIGILTLPLHNNYGGILQAWALMETLCEMGHESWLIDRRMPRHPFYIYPLAYCKRAALKYLAGQKDRIVFIEKKRERAGKPLREFCADHIDSTEPVYSSAGLRRIDARMKFDAYIIGSDQVWRPRYSPCIEDYFLGFLPGGSRAKRIAYAASFGTDRWEYSPQQEKLCGDMLKKFDAVSVREETAVELCLEHWNIEPSHQLDPTLLIDREAYLKLAEHIELAKPRTLLTYILDPTPDTDALIEKTAENEGLLPYSICATLSAPAPSIGRWLAGFRDAETIITDSFHACVFSIIFERPFIVYCNPERGRARLDSLLKIFGLEDRLVFSAAEAAAKEFAAIDWENVKKVLTQRKKEAENFLKTALDADQGMSTSY